MKQTGRYVIILILAVALWNTIVIKPLKIFSVFLHELGHSLMAVIFGHGIAGFRINFNESGYALTLPRDGFSAFMIANGGYLGSVLFALLILRLKRTFAGKYIWVFPPHCCRHVDRVQHRFHDHLCCHLCWAVLIIYMMKMTGSMTGHRYNRGDRRCLCGIRHFCRHHTAEVNRKLGLIPGWGAHGLLRIQCSLNE